ncbi:MAG: 3-phosphoshikimate 1-carboxyvinyltransferase [Ruminococcaceae bacterium]|nr:3-phosphoshikimate 1-carboxyvinyltransferase [Oscillospiraceae bacterium]
MNITITPHLLRGEVNVIPSKSQAHRLLICAAFADSPTQLVCSETNQDIEATVSCLRALGAQIDATDSGYTVMPIRKAPECAVLDCNESGSTLRFMLPIVGALGVDGTFLMKGRLASRPLSPLWEEMERMGCSLCRPTQNTLRCTGKLKSGDYAIDGSVSSQFITGLMFAHSLMKDCSLTVTGKLESKPYIDLTNAALALFPSNRSPGYLTVEGDWSNGAFWLTANALGSELTIRGLDTDSLQGDRAVLDVLKQLNEGIPTVSAADIPDLVPILSVAAAAKQGAVFTNIQRLRLKESDRVASVIALLEALGGSAAATGDTLTVSPARFTGGTVDSCNDHRIAMAAAIAATVSTGPVTILGAEAVKKSYPQFWAEYRRLGGKYE